MVFNSMPSATPAKTSPAHLGGGKRGLCPIGDHTSLMLGDSGQNVDRETVGRRHVGGDKVNAVVLQAADERDGPSEPIELGDRQRRFVDATIAKGRFKGRAIWSTTALDLLVLSDDQTVTDEPENGFALRFQAQAALPLSLGRNPEVQDPTLAHCGVPLNGR